MVVEDIEGDDVGVLRRVHDLNQAVVVPGQGSLGRAEDLILGHDGGRRGNDIRTSCCLWEKLIQNVQIKKMFLDIKRVENNEDDHHHHHGDEDDDDDL